MNLEDTFVIAGAYERIANPDRRWWQFWKPRFVAGKNLQRFNVRSGLTNR